ncbi:flavodoxin domain-containing protein [Thermodesulfobacteriota bacterium]
MRCLTRRNFIINGSLAMGGTLGTIAFGGDLLSPNHVHALDAEFSESSCGLKGKKVLVAYASLCGSTGGVAEAIGEVFCKKGASVDVRLLENVKDLNQYRAAVIGSSVQSSSWRSEAIDFVKANQKILSRIPVAYFLTCLALYKDNSKNRSLARSYMNPVLEAVPDVHPVDTGHFAGVLDYSKLNFIFRVVMKSKMKKQGIPEGDFRNWDAIISWAEGISSLLIAI